MIASGTPGSHGRNVATGVMFDRQSGRKMILLDGFLSSTVLAMNACVVTVHFFVKMRSGLCRM